MKSILTGKTAQKLTLLTVALSSLLTVFAPAESRAQTPTPPRIIVRRFIIPSALSASNAPALSAIMSFVTQNPDPNVPETYGYISTDYLHDPTALNRPRLLRVSQIMSSTTSAFYLWDGTNNPTGNFATQNGSREVYVVDWQQNTAFMVSNIWFMLDSTDQAKQLRYSGNLATNTSGGAPLVFSPTFRGEYINGNGTTNVYVNGESVTNHPVHRIIAAIRLTWTVANMSAVSSDITYFKNEMRPFGHSAAFYTLDGTGITNWIWSLPVVENHPFDANGNEIVNVLGQRQVPGIVYNLEQRARFSATNNWMTVATNLVDGASYTNNSSLKEAYYRVKETNSVAPPPTFAPSSVAQQTEIPKITLVVEND